MAADAGKANKRVKRRIAAFPKKYRAKLRAAIGEDDIVKQKKQKWEEVCIVGEGGIVERLAWALPMMIIM